MSTLVHTADVHLDPAAPERRRALAAVLARAEAADADAVTIGGDLFEDATAAERLRPDLRTLFAERPFPVLTIPGNHDRTAFEGDAYFGQAVRSITAEPFEHVIVGDDAARVTCVPYTPTADESLLVALRDREPFDGPECLLLHCSLETPTDGGTGDEAASRYCPVTRSELGALEFDAVLGGHFHGASVRDLPTEDSAPGVFVYPGTPASVTADERGRRSVAVFETAPEPAVRLDHLESFHYDECRLTVRPGEAEAALGTIRERVAEWSDREVEARVTVEGFIDRDEGDFAADIDAACGEVAFENRTRSVEHLLEHPVHESIAERLDADRARDAARSDPSDPEALAADARQRVLAAMADLAAEGDLS